MYFDEAIRLHFELGYGEDRIAEILPIGHTNPHGNNQRHIMVCSQRCVQGIKHHVEWSYARPNSGRMERDDKIPHPWRNAGINTFSESGMYKLAFRCQSSEAADRFTNWVAGEVLPTIRKTGATACQWATCLGLRPFLWGG